MQKDATHLNNSKDKDKIKEIKTTPRPVENPKKAEILREADKKQIKKFIKSTGALVVGLLLSCIWFYEIDRGSTISMNLASPAHTPPLHYYQGLKTTERDIDQDELLVSPSVRPRNGKDEILLKKIPHDYVGKGKISENKEGKYGIVFSDNQYALDFNSPIYSLVEMINTKWKAPINFDCLDVNKIVDIQDNPSQGFYLNDNSLDRYKHLILITLELKEFTESSSKALYSLTPQNKARIKLVLRGVDAKSQAMLFEQEIAHEATFAGWANYQPIETDTILHTYPNSNYTHSEAMHQALERTSKDIISILNNYFP